MKPRCTYLTVLSTERRAHTAPSRIGHTELWAHCQCVCGKSLTIRMSSVAEGKRTSCGCKRGLARRGIARTHGACVNGGMDRLYILWRGMITRCSDPDHPSSRYYFHKAIKVCLEWHDYGTFRTWALAHGYKPGLTIERKQSTGNYEPDNCEWITRSENGRRANAGRKAKEEWMVREILRLTAEVNKLSKLIGKSYGDQ